MKIKPIIITLLLSCLLSSSVYAEKKPDTNSSFEKEKAYSFGEITVSARKEAENIQKVTASVDAFSDVEIEDSGSKSFADLTSLMPNIYSNSNYGINRIVFRGLKGPDSLLWAPSGFYVDGVNYLAAEMRNPDLFDLESVEVLRGPQGTLYGANSETGVVNITTRKPNNKYSARLRGGYSSFNTYDLTGKANLPLVQDKLLFNAAVATRNSDGYMENEYTDDYASGIKHLSLRGALRWLVSEAFTVSLTADYFNYDDEDGSFRIDQGIGKTDRYKIDYNGPNSNERDGNTQALRVDYKARAYDFVSITTRTNFSHTYDGDGDLTSGSASTGDMEYHMTKDFDAYTQEFRISSPEGRRPWKWLAGFYGMLQDTDVTKQIDMLAWRMGDDRVSEVKSQNMAAFGQVTYSFIEDLHLTVGLRLDHTNLEGEQDYKNYYGMPFHFEDDIEDTEVLPKMSLAYDLTEGAMVYASVSKGFLAGGFNTSFGSSKDLFTYDIEEMWSYEVGAKTSWLDDRLIVNFSAFWQEVSDKQVKKVVMNDRWIDNADGARSVGFELSVKARPVQGLDLFAGLGFVDAQFTDWRTSLYDYKDNTLAFAPQYTYSAGIQYRHDSGVFSRLDMSGVSSYYTDPENDIECDGYALFNLKLGYETDNWAVNLWCRNLFDKEYLTDKRFWSDSDIAVIDGPPRTVGIELSARF